MDHKWSRGCIELTSFHGVFITKTTSGNNSSPVKPVSSHALYVVHDLFCLTLFWTQLKALIDFKNHESKVLVWPMPSVTPCYNQHHHSNNNHCNEICTFAILTRRLFQLWSFVRNHNLVQHHCIVQSLQLFQFLRYSFQLFRYLMIW